MTLRRGPGWPSATLLPRAVAAGLAGAFLARLLMYPGGAPDDGEQAVYAQALRLLYDRENPGLISWLLWGLERIFGPHPSLVVALRFALLALFYALLLGAARAALGRTRAASIGAAAPLLLWFVGFDALFNYTHSVLLLPALAGSLWAAVRLLARGRDADAAWLGLAMGVGLLAKYSFPLWAAGLVAALLLADRWRGAGRVRLRHLALAGALAAALAVGPYAALLAEGAALRAQASAYLQTGADAWAGLEGVGLLLSKLLQFALPFAAVAALAALVPGRADPSDPPAPAGARTLVVLAPLLTLLLTVAALLASGTTFLRTHHLFVLATLPLALLCAARAPWQGTRRGAALAGALVLAWAALPLAVAGKALWEPARCRKCYLMLDWSGPAAALTAAGWTGGEIRSVSSDYMEPGENLRLLLPRATLTTAKLAFMPPPPPPGADDCLLVWDAGRPPTPLPALPGALSGTLPVARRDPLGVGRHRPGQAMGWSMTPGRRCP